jgi:hypothetical protein
MIYQLASLYTVGIRGLNNTLTENKVYFNLTTRAPHKSEIRLAKSGMLSSWISEGLLV